MSEPKKSLGQHWLHDEQALDAMVAAADVQPNDTVLEVGPGLGTLTQKLLAAGAKVHCVEFDKALIPGLRKKFGQIPGFSIEQADILDFDFGTLPVYYKIVANIPYYLTSNLLRVMCESQNHFSQAALLVQKEVAQRVVASPGQMSLLSVSVQFYAQTGLGMVVPAGLFTPAPKVDSQILVLTYRAEPLFEDVDSKRFFRVVRAGFSERRKMLRSSLGGGLGITKQEAETLLRSAGLDPSLRAQVLSLDDWYNIYTVLTNKYN